jgi:beta-phosphoglucomutase
MKNYEAVIFDLDGVITDTAAFHYAAWKKLADELDIYFDREINESLKGIDRMASLEIVLKKSAKRYTKEEKVQLADKKNDYYKQMVEQMTPNDILPGVKTLLEKLRTQNIKIALASASKNAFTVIDKLGLQTYFDYLVDAGKIKHSKPDPEIFITAANGLLVPCDKCIGVEDAKAGIKAIKAAGMFAVGIGSPQILCEADDVISGLDKFNIDKYQVS